MACCVYIGRLRHFSMKVALMILQNKFARDGVLLDGAIGDSSVVAIS